MADIICQCDILTPYLNGIQGIPGKVPGKKYQELKIAAKQVAEKVKQGQELSSSLAASGFAEILHPLIEVEAAKVLKDHEAILRALKSNDTFVLNRALHAKWFYTALNCSIIGVGYFLEHLFPHISLQTRTTIIKKLAINLKDVRFAREFFLAITQAYGIRYALPLLIACDEHFIHDAINKYQIILSESMLAKIYKKYPAVAIMYLKLSKPENTRLRNMLGLKIHNYLNFLPRLVKNHCQEFVEILEMHGGLPVKLGEKRTELFMRNSSQILIDNPKRYLNMLRLKMVTARLTKDLFDQMFANLFPEDKSKFSVQEMSTYLQYYFENEKASLILSTFKNVYGVDLLECKDLVTWQFILMLPTEERVNQARIKLAEDKDWHLYDPKNSWRCYLPVLESIPVIKTELSQTSNAEKRGQLLLLLVHTCRINNDSTGLMDCLNYVMNRHRNERVDIRWLFIKELVVSLDTFVLGNDHWTILDEYIQKAFVQDEHNIYPAVMIDFLVKCIYHKMTKGIVVEKELNLLIYLKMKTSYGSWNLYPKHAEFNRRCLIFFLSNIPKKYPESHRFWSDGKFSWVQAFLGCIQEFNTKIAKKSDESDVSIKDYPWLETKIYQVFTEPISWYHYSSRNKMLQSLKNIDQELFERCAMTDYLDINYMNVQDISKILKNNPEDILNKSTKYLERFGEIIHQCNAQSLIRKSLWYQEIPIKFLNQCLQDFNDRANAKQTLIILAHLLDGRAFAQFLDKYLPTDSEMDADVVEQKNTYETRIAIPTVLKYVDSAISLDILLKFCVQDYLTMALRSSTAVAWRAPVSKVIDFATSIITREISVKKHGIVLMGMVAPIEQWKMFLSNLWHIEPHRSIRGVIFKKIYKTFCKHPEISTWHMTKKCITSLTPDDEETAFEYLTKFENVPNHYISDFVAEVFNVFDSMELTGLETTRLTKYVRKLLLNIDAAIVNLLPEALCKKIISKYVFTYRGSLNVYSAGNQFLVKSYITSCTKSLEDRLKFVSNYLVNVLMAERNGVCPEGYPYLPINFILRDFIAEITLDGAHEESNLIVFETFLKSLTGTLHPEEFSTAYLALNYCIQYKKSKSPKEFGINVANQLPNLIKALSPECMMLLANEFNKFQSSCRFQGIQKNECELNIVGGLLKAGTRHSLILAAMMLGHDAPKKFGDRYEKVIEILRDQNDPVISGTLNMLRNSFRTDC